MARSDQSRSGKARSGSLLVPLLILGAVPFVMVLGNSMLIPLFPKMGEAMDLTPFQVGLLITAFSVPAGIVIPFAGAVSDHIGRRLIMAPALILYGAGGFVAGTAAILLTQPYGWVLAGRIIQGIGAGGTYQLAMALVGDLLEGGKRTQALGWLEAANGLGKVASPVVGSLVALIVWYAAFFTYGLLALPVAVAVWFLVPEGEDRPKQSPGKYVKGLAAIFKARGVQLAACYAIGASALFLLFGLLSYVSDDLEARFGLTGLIKGLAVAVPVAASSVMAFTFGTLLQSRPKWARPTILAGTLVVSVGLALVPWAMRRNLWFYFPGIALPGFGIGMLLPPLNSLITGAAGRDERGVITAFYGSVRFFGVAAGPPLFALAAGLGRVVLFLSAAALGAVVFAVAWLFVKPEKMQPRKGRGGGEPGKKGEEAARTPAPAPVDERVPAPARP